jgi:hypothetical protein
MIASYLVRETAITVALGREKVSPLGPYRFSYDPSRPTYVSFIKVDGRHYIQKIQSSPRGISTLLKSSRNASDKSQFICRLPVLDGAKDCFVAADSSGILQMFPVYPHQREAWCRNYPAIPGAWWYLKPDLSTTAGGCLHEIYWKIPMANPPTIIDLGTMQEPRVKQDLNVRMRLFECNTPDIVGYSVALDHRGNLLTVFSHKRDQGLNQPILPIVPGLEDITDPVELSLAFMPLHQGEQISQIYTINRKYHKPNRRPPFPGATGILVRPQSSPCRCA